MALGRQKAMDDGWAGVQQVLADPCWALVTSWPVELHQLISSVLHQPGRSQGQLVMVSHPNNTKDMGKQNYSLLPSVSCSNPPAVKCKGKILLRHSLKGKWPICYWIVKTRLLGHWLYIWHDTYYTTSKKIICDCKCGTRELSLSFVSVPFLFPGASPIPYIAFSLPLASGTSRSYEWHSFLLFWLGLFFPGLSAILSALTDKHHSFYSWTQ